MINSDTALFLAKKGSRKAFKFLYDRNVDKLFRFLDRFGSDRCQTEEWVQRAFIKAFLNLNTFNGKSGFSTWLFSIALNEMRSDFSSAYNKYVLLQNDDDLDLNNNESDSVFEWQDEMNYLLDKLDELSRAVFILFLVEGYKHDEISEMLGISSAASRVILHRAKERLKVEYKKL